MREKGGAPGVTQPFDPHGTRLLSASAQVAPDSVSLSSNEPLRTETHEKDGRQSLWLAAGHLITAWDSSSGDSDKSFADRRHSGVHKYYGFNAV